MTVCKKNLRAFSMIEMSIVLVILGIVITGIPYFSRVIKEYRLNTARNLSATSDAASIKGVVLWLDATAENSITNTSNSYTVNNNDTVKTWIDQNKQLNEKFVATQKAASEGPIYIENGINGLPTMYFDYAASAGDGLNIPFSRTLNPDQFTLFVVAQPIENTANWETLIMSRDAVTNVYTGYNLYKNISTSNFELWTGSSSEWVATSDSSTFNFNYPYIITSVRTGKTTSDTSLIYKNGTLGGSTSSKAFSPNNSPNESTATFKIGHNSGFFFDGYISEIILYDRHLKDTERKMVESYLSQKYKIQLNS